MCNNVEKPVASARLPVNKYVHRIVNTQAVNLYVAIRTSVLVLVSVIVIPILAESEGFEPSVPISQYAFLAGRWFKPLTQLSVYVFTSLRMPFQVRSLRALLMNLLSFRYSCTNLLLHS